MTQAALKIEYLHHAYRNTVVLKDISFQVNSGEFVGLVGVNGAGKSTLIKSILDFSSIKSGDIALYGVPHRDIEAREKLCFLPEKFLPPHYLTGKDFLLYMAKLEGHDLAEGDIKHIFKVLDLDISALSKPVRQLSKGMSQKLGLAACFLSNRPLLIMDEPMSGLDPKARSYLKRHLRSIKQQEKTLFFSTHLLSDVESLCDRIIVLHEGMIQFDGSPQECCEKYGQTSLEAAYMSCIGEP